MTSALRAALQEAFIKQRVQVWDSAVLHDVLVDMRAIFYDSLASLDQIPNKAV